MTFQTFLEAKRPGDNARGDVIRKLIVLGVQTEEEWMGSLPPRRRRYQAKTRKMMSAVNTLFREYYTKLRIRGIPFYSRDEVYLVLRDVLPRGWPLRTIPEFPIEGVAYQRSHWILKDAVEPIQVMLEQQRPLNESVFEFASSPPLYTQMCAVLRDRSGGRVLYVSGYLQRGYDVRPLVADGHDWGSCGRSDLQRLARVIASGEIKGGEVLHLSLANIDGEFVDDLLFDLKSMSVV